MSPNDHSGLWADIRKLRQEIERLSEEQSEALEKVTFLGMTAEEAKEFAARRDTLKRLVEELACLEPERKS